MKINNNTWNKIRYTFYAPVYDLIVKSLNRSRNKSIQSLNIRSGDRVLIVGAGTGLDLKYLPFNCEIMATDITPSMVSRIRKRKKELDMNVKCRVMDGQKLDFADQTFDQVILHLILAVIPDPVATILEVERVLKVGGEVVVFDKFVRKGKSLSRKRKFVNLFTNVFFSDITRDIESIISNTKLRVLSDQDADFGGNFRRIKLLKSED